MTEFPKRIWMSPNAAETVWNKRLHKKENEYLSIKEHRSLIREARAEAFDECSGLCQEVNNDFHGLLFADMAAQIREGKK